MPLEFTQDFVGDYTRLAAIMRQAIAGEPCEPLALSRFGDGEFAIMNDIEFSARRSGWFYDEGATVSWRDQLRESYEWSGDGYYLGIPSAETHWTCHSFFMDRITTPISRICASEILFFANYARFVSEFTPEEIRKCFAIVGGFFGDVRIPKNCIANPPDLRDVVKQMEDTGRHLLVCAGPFASVIVREYWMRVKSRKICLDIGSALDPWLRGITTRKHHQENQKRRRKWEPRFYPWGGLIQSQRYYSGSKHRFR